MEKKQRQKQKRHQNNKQAAQNARLIIILLALYLSLSLSLTCASQRLELCRRARSGVGGGNTFRLRRLHLPSPPSLSHLLVFCSMLYLLYFSAFLLLCALYCFDFALFLVSGLCSSLRLLLCEKPKRSHGTFNPLLTTCIALLLGKREKEIAILLIPLYCENLICQFVWFFYRAVTVVYK